MRFFRNFENAAGGVLPNAGHAGVGDHLATRNLVTAMTLSFFKHGHRL